MTSQILRLPAAQKVLKSVLIFQEILIELELLVILFLHSFSMTRVVSVKITNIFQNIFLFTILSVLFWAI